MMLSDGDIVRRLKSKSYHTRIVIDPCRIIRDVQPCSVDLHLSNDLKKQDGTEYTLDEDSNYTLKPNEFILGSTMEYVEIPEDLSAFVDGKSTMGRLGITAHVTAGFIDAGFKGNITLEIKNLGETDFILEDGMSICQIVFFKLSSPVKRLYGSENVGSHYQNSEGTVLSKHEKN